MPEMFTMEIDGVTVLNRGLSRYSEYLKDLSPVFKQFVEDFYVYEGKVFNTSGSHSGAKWASLSPITARQKLGNLPILTRTGDLRASLTGGPGTLREIASLRLLVGTQIPYAVYHQRGTKKMPARPPIRLSEDLKMGWMKRLHKYAVDKMKESIE